MRVDVRSCRPSPEVCNGLDDDCDGLIDEDLGTTTCGVGECQVTVQNCVDGVPQICVPKTPGVESPEAGTCADSKDNDCDGLTDQQDPDCVVIDCSHAFASPATLWPPNHKYAKVSIAGVTGAATISVTGITQDEPLDSYGDGHTCPDGAGVGTGTALVRAERARSRRNSRDGRVYHINFTADDGYGGQCTGMVSVCVPPNKGRKGRTCVDGGALFDSTGPCTRR